MRFDGVDAFERSGFAPRVVIVGSGPAGLTLALRLEAHGVACLVVEAGGLEYRAASQELYRGRVVGDDYFDLHACRLRMFGGSSQHWTGWCRALDTIDFEARPGVANSGWPIAKAELDRYADAAAALLQVPLPAADRPLDDGIDAIEMAFSPPVRFGAEFREAVERSPHIGLLLDTPVLELVPQDARVAALVVATPRGPRRLAAERVALCTGGIENSRLLLWSNACHDGRVVAQPATLGRYWMEHPSYTVGDALLADGADAHFAPGRMFAPSPAALRRLRIGGAQIWFTEVQRDSWLVKRLVRDALCVAPELFERLLALTGQELRCGGSVHMEWEQLPQAENRVALGSGRDALGVPPVELHWRKTEADWRTLREAGRLFGEALLARRLGRFRFRPWTLAGEAWPDGHQAASWHHMGGTRMAASADDGVVDGDCRVFGLDNLWIGGSSVFPTSGHANPTFTIVQLALRLGDHLAREVARG